jgi:hypothetical protein
MEQICTTTQAVRDSDTRDTIPPAEETEVELVEFHYNCASRALYETLVQRLFSPLNRRKSDIEEADARSLWTRRCVNPFRCRRGGRSPSRLSGDDVRQQLALDLRDLILQHQLSFL